MRTKKMLIFSIIVLSVIAFFNIIMAADIQVSVSVKGKGNAFIETNGNRTTYGCDRLNENACSMTAASTVK